MTAARVNKEKQYFIALIPPPPVFEEALNFKHYFKDKFHSKASLNSPPHITLHMPFRWREDRETELTASLGAFAGRSLPFEILAKNFGCFAPRVIFINILANEELVATQRELLRHCKRELNLFNADYRDQPFHPHLTLAFRDLKKNVFPLAWEEFSRKAYEARWLVDRLVLLKHDGNVWKEFRSLDLGENH